MIRRSGACLLVAGSDLRTHRVSLDHLAAALAEPLAAAVAGEIEGLLALTELTGRRREAVRRSLVADRLQGVWWSGCWLLRRRPGASFGRQAMAAGSLRRLGSFILAYAVSYSLLLGSWWALGIGILQGRLVRGWLAAWVLLLVTLIPFRQVSVWSRSRLAIGGGALLKRRLLAGALELRPEEIRTQGAGQLLGRVIESEAVETLALLGAFLGVSGMVESLMAIGVLAAGAGGVRHALLLAGWLLVAAALSWWSLRARRGWTTQRLAMTHDLVESLVGHRTRLAQEPPEGWHAADDRSVDLYLRESRRFDRSRVLLLALVPRGWLLVGACGILPAFMGGRSSGAGLALAVGGLLAAYRGLAKAVEGVSHLAGASLSWSQAAPLFQAASRTESGAAGYSRETAPASASGPPPAGGGHGHVVLEAQDLSYRHQGRSQATLDRVSLRVFAGDRVLLGGPSGGGKSTLAAVLSGLREPDSGLVLLGGLDRVSIGGERWRKRVVLAPQFHENHVFTETLAFNLLMGRRWPPSADDLLEAAEICGELGLGPLLERMPSGLHQLVGDGGWQLSHGECSRLFMARALLQGGEVVILDESLAALDPENLDQALACALRRSPALMVIAHP